MALIDWFECYVNVTCHRESFGIVRKKSGAPSRFFQKPALLERFAVPRCVSRHPPRPLAASDCRCGWRCTLVGSDHLSGDLGSTRQLNDHNVIEHEVPPGKAALSFRARARTADAAMRQRRRLQGERDGRARERAGRRDDRRGWRGLGAVATQRRRWRYGGSSAARNDAADTMLGLAAALGGWLLFVAAESGATHTGCGGAGGRTSVATRRITSACIALVAPAAACVLRAARGATLRSRSATTAMTRLSRPRRSSSR